MKDNVKRMKKRVTHWEHIFTEPISDKRLVFIIYKESQISITRK